MQMQQLEDSGYSAFAFGIFEEDVQFVSTTDATIFSHSAVIQFLSALIGASKYTLICSTRIFVCTCHCVGNPPQIDKVISEFLSTNAETKHCRRKTDNHPAEEEREMVGCDLQSSTGRKRKFTSSDHPNPKKRKTTSSQSKDPSSNTKSKAAGEGRLDLVSLLTSTNNTGNLPPSTSNHPHSNDGLPSSHDLPRSLHSSNSDDLPPSSDHLHPSNSNDSPPFIDDLCPSNSDPPPSSDDLHPSNSDELPPSNDDLRPSNSNEPPPSNDDLRPSNSDEPPPSNDDLTATILLSLITCLVVHLPPQPFTNQFHLPPELMLFPSLLVQCLF